MGSAGHCLIMLCTYSGMDRLNRFYFIVENSFETFVPISSSLTMMQHTMMKSILMMMKSGLQFLLLASFYTLQHAESTVLF